MAAFVCVSTMRDVILMPGFGADPHRAHLEARARCLACLYLIVFVSPLKQENEPEAKPRFKCGHAL